VRSGPGSARTILLFHIISARPSKQPLTVRTFLKVYMELGSSFLFLQDQIQDIIITATASSQSKLNANTHGWSVCAMTFVLEEVDFMMHPHHIGFATHIYVPEPLGAIFIKTMHNNTVHRQKRRTSVAELRILFYSILVFTSIIVMADTEQHTVEPDARAAETPPCYFIVPVFVIICFYTASIAWILNPSLNNSLFGTDNYELFCQDYTCT
jgi:hypothetical protein